MSVIESRSFKVVLKTNDQYLSYVSDSWSFSKSLEVQTVGSLPFVKTNSLVSTQVGKTNYNLPPYFGKSLPFLKVNYIEPSCVATVGF